MSKNTFQKLQNLLKQFGCEHIQPIENVLYLCRAKPKSNKKRYS